MDETRKSRGQAIAQLEDRKAADLGREEGFFNDTAESGKLFWISGEEVWVSDVWCDGMIDRNSAHVSGSEEHSELDECAREYEIAACLWERACRPRLARQARQAALAAAFRDRSCRPWESTDTPLAGIWAASLRWP